LNTNQKAIELLEENKYDEALILFQKAVIESRDVQSLTNLAWIYVHEEDNYDAALELMEEAIQMKPTSHFPYNLLGEIYTWKEMWQNASDILLESIAITPSLEAYKNLGVANYHL
jgi:tetratricopeptide (TPR) repeat protein